MKRALVIGVAALGLLVAGGFYVLNLITSDHLEFDEHDLAYMMVVTSETVSGLPRFKLDGEPVSFVYHARDGTAPEQIVMIYRSEDSPEELLRKYRDHCQASGFALVSGNFLFEQTQLSCDAEDYRIEFGLSGAADATDVTVNLVGRL